MLKKVFSHTKFLEEQNLDFMSQKTLIPVDGLPMGRNRPLSLHG